MDPTLAIILLIVAGALWECWPRRRKPWQSGYEDEAMKQERKRRKGD